MWFITLYECYLNFLYMKSLFFVTLFFFWLLMQMIGIFHVSFTSSSMKETTDTEIPTRRKKEGLFSSAFK